MPSVFTVHELLAVSCRLVLVPLPVPLPILPQIVLPLQSQKLNSPFVQKLFGPCRRKQSSRVVWQNGRLADGPVGLGLGSARLSLSLGPRSVINLICNEAFLKFILFVLLEYARECVWTGLPGHDPENGLKCQSVLEIPPLEHYFIHCKL